MSLPNDDYGRAISVVTAEGFSIYTVKNTDNTIAFTLELKDDAPLERVYSSINGMAPADWQQ